MADLPSQYAGVVFTNIPILVLVLTLVVYDFNHMPDFISITVSRFWCKSKSSSLSVLTLYF